MSEIIDINVSKQVEQIDVNVTENVIEVNINTINGGGAEWGEIEGTLSNQTDLQNALDLKANTSDLGAVAFSNDYNDLDNLPNIPSIDNLVPYAGATQNVDLGEYQIKAGQVEFDTTPTGNAGVGILRWNDSDGTLDLGLKGGNVNLQIGQEQLVRVVNKTGSNLLESNYQAVRVNGAQGQRLKVALAQATNDLLSAETIGLVTENIDNNQEGFVTTSGLIRGINTTGSLQGETWADGDMLYLSPFVAGRITNIKPTAPNHLIVVGYVVYAHANNGSIFVKVDNGYELEELHNVTETNYTTPIDTDSLLTFDITNSLWKRLSWANIKSNLNTYFDTIYQTALGFTPENVANKATNLTSPDNTKYPTTLAVSTALSGKQDTLTNPITGTGANGQVAFFNGTTTQTSDSVFIWDNTNKRLGVGSSATPQARLDVRAQGALSTDIAFRVRNSADTANLFNVNGNGAFEFNGSVGSGVLGTINGSVNFNGNGLSGVIFNLPQSRSLSWSNADQRLFLEYGNNFAVTRLGVATATFGNNTLLIGTTTNIASSILTLESTTKGFLPPRMTTTQRNAIATPAAGLVVYDTTDNKHYGYNGTNWNAFY